MRRSWEKRIGAGVVVLVLLAGMAPGRPATAQADWTASLQPEQGLVQLWSVAGALQDWQTVTRRELVAPGDYVRTDHLGLATLTFFDGLDAQIMPDSQVRVDRMVVGLDSAGADVATFDVSLDVIVGDAISRLDRAVDAEATYSVRTPGAVITVRGTEFWVSVTPDAVTRVGVIAGIVSVASVIPPEAGGEVVELTEGQGVGVSAYGEFDPVGDAGPPPAAPPVAALVSPGCGDGRCDPAEEDSCPLDCAEVPDCGDGVCDREANEGPVTCPEDCIMNLPEPEYTLSYVHFFWGEDRCDTEPDQPLPNPVLFFWGIGCFDTQAQAAAHPHPADYQLTIDGQAWDMSGLRQSGPYVHSPYCPWGWTFELGPMVLPLGTHEMVLTETATDTWTAESSGRTAGETATLACTITIGPQEQPSQRGQ